MPTKKYVIKVKFSFRRDWLLGFAFGVGLEKAEVLKRVRAAIEEECSYETECKFKVVYDQGFPPGIRDWGVRVEHVGLEAPSGCHVRRLSQAAKSGMRKTLDRMVSRD